MAAPVSYGRDKIHLGNFKFTSCSQVS